jgi:hypothetical protein
LFFCPLILASQGSGEGSARNAAVYLDADSYQIYTVLLQSEKHSPYVVRAETDGYPDLTTKNLGIKGDSDFMRVWATKPVSSEISKITCVSGREPLGGCGG